MTILMVEDSSTNRVYLKKILEHAGHTVLAAANGVEALKVLAANRVDCLLTDLTMPQLDGWGLIARIREKQEWANLPIILITGSAEIDDVKRARAVGLKHYVVKPIDADRVLAAVAQATAAPAEHAAP